MRAGIAILATLLALGGCADLGRMSSSFQHLVTSGMDRMSARRIADDPIYLNAMGPLAVDIVSFNGTVNVEADPEATQVTIFVERLATHGYGRKWEADDSLAEIQYSAEILTGPTGPSLVIRTSTTHAEPHFQRVRFDISMPDIDGVQIATTNGDVGVVNARGSIDITTTDGDVRVMTMKPLIERVSIVNADGDIDYRVRGESTGSIDCEALRGHVSHHTRFGSMVVDRGTDHDTLKATLNRGANPVYLRTSDGDIRVSVVADPTAAVGALIRH